MSPRKPTACTAFTLIEVLIVVVLLGVLAAIVIANVSTTSDDAQRTAFVRSGRIFANAATRYWIENGDYLEGAASGVLPAGFEPYVMETAWGETPIGGVWDTERDSFGVRAAIGVHFDGTGVTRDDAYMTTLDDMVDDGDLATGGFRKLDTDRYYFIIAN
jgi:prepilin-type N-terminal cleavage/methylation domain-containing protein